MGMAVVLLLLVCVHECQCFLYETHTKADTGIGMTQEELRNNLVRLIHFIEQNRVSDLTTGHIGQIWDF